MNALKKKAAVKKYAAEKEAGKTKEEILELLNADEKEYASEEVVEILEEVFAEGDSNKNTPPAKKSKKKDDAVHYQEWDVQITGKTYEKLKVSREVVKITEEEAETLNHGVSQGGNNYAKMYFLPE